jgi:hypothetical protein
VDARQRLARVEKDLPLIQADMARSEADVRQSEAALAAAQKVESMVRSDRDLIAADLAGCDELSAIEPVYVEPVYVEPSVVVIDGGTSIYYPCRRTGTTTITAAAGITAERGATTAIAARAAVRAMKRAGLIVATMMVALIDPAIPMANRRPRRHRSQGEDAATARRKQEEAKAAERHRQEDAAAAASRKAALDRAEAAQAAAREARQRDESAPRRCREPSSPAGLGGRGAAPATAAGTEAAGLVVVFVLDRPRRFGFLVIRQQRWRSRIALSTQV